MKLLIVEDHPKLRENIIRYFHLKWHNSEWAIHGEEALDKIKKTQYDTIILDINLPIINGKELLKTIRKSQNNTPVIALTSNSQLDDKLEIFSLWADDYLTKPFELAELEVRILALWRRQSKAIIQAFSFRDIEIDIMGHKVTKWWKPIELWNKEFLILEFLAKNIGSPKSKSEIIEYVWGERETSLTFESVTLEAHISYIRKKLWHDCIKTIKGVGYVIEK